MLQFLTLGRPFCRVSGQARSLGDVEVAVPDSQSSAVPFAAQAVLFHEMLATGKIPDGLLSSPYVAEQFVERLVHYVLSIPAGSYSMANLSKLLEQVDPASRSPFSGS